MQGKLGRGLVVVMMVILMLMLVMMVMAMVVMVMVMVVMMMIKASCPQVSLNLNDISSHTKQIGETSRLVQQVSADFEIFNF